MAETLTVRTARPSDLAAVDALLSRSYPALVRGDYPPSVVVLALPLLARANPKLLASGTYHVAEAEDGAILGAGGWTSSGLQGVREPGMGHVRHVATDHRMVRQGIGTRIMTHTLSQARAAGMTTMDCLSTRTAVPFYAALGFRSLGPVEVGLRPGIVFPAVRMTRRL